MKIIKSSGEEVTFNKSNIIRAIQSANMRVSLDKRFSDADIKNIVSNNLHVVNPQDVASSFHNRTNPHNADDIAVDPNKSFILVINLFILLLLLFILINN